MRRVMMAVLVQVAACGCGTLPPGTACTALYAYGVSVTLTDATTGAPISNATLALTEGTYVETMQLMPGGDYVGAGERAGTYTLTAAAPGFETQTIADLVVLADVCHVQGIHVNVQLTPVPLP